VAKCTTAEEMTNANREAMKIAKLRHPNIILTVDDPFFIIEPNLLVCVPLEFAPFGDLSSFLGRMQKGEAPYTPKVLILLLFSI